MMAAAVVDTRDESINDKLPTQILMRVFDYCSYDELLTSLDVCHLWRSLIHDHVTKRMRYLEFTESAQQLMWMNDSVFKCVTNIDLVKCDLVTIVYFRTLLSRVEGVVKLRVLYENVKDDLTSSVGALFKNVTARVESFEFSLHQKDCLPGVALLNALLLMVSKTSRVTLTQLKLEVSKTSRDTLAQLKLENIQCTGGSIADVLKRCRCLKHLTLPGALITNGSQCLNEIRGLPQLEYLNLRWPTLDHSLHSFLMQAINKGAPEIMSNITIAELYVSSENDMELQFVRRVDELVLHGMDADHLMSLVSCLRSRSSYLSVGTLDVHFCTLYITDDILLYLILELADVEKINAFPCRLLTAEGKADVMAVLPSLEWI